ncbi:MAG TPA: UvrD-helicase domain-containing protein, partial [Polyangiaceae bacterium]|nr:UvrD-helicase domain-containing protein [Polyangiaceae bacterium]
GAGTGKTRVITVRIAELIQSGITPSRILAVTFTNKAAREMRERAQGLLGRRKKNQKGPEISTFHSLCVRVLRRHARLLGYPENYTIYDRGDQESLARGALRDIRVGTQKLRPGDLISQISQWKGAGITPAQAQQRAKKDVELLCSLAYEKYQQSLRVSGAMDFDDLLLNTELLFAEHPEARFAEASRFDHLLIDEYQDTNGLQYRIVKSLAERHRNLCVVGDDDQSIYGWRGAEVEHILNFKDHWPEARVVRLEDNYRCTEWIIHLANTLIAHNTARHDKVLRAARGRGSTPRFLKFDDETQEAEAVVREIQSKIQREDEERVPASDIAILFRTNEQPRAFEQELRAAGVPYLLVGGQSFYDRKEVKDLLSYLRVLANPADEVSLLRIVNVPARGIGPSSIQVLLDDAVRDGVPLWKVLPAASVHPGVAPAAATALENFRRLVEEFRARLGRESLSNLVGELIGRIDYKGELARLYKDPAEHEARLGAVEDLVNAVVTYERRNEEPTLNGFLEESTLSSRDDEKDDDSRTAHSVTLMTLHSAKGLEFPHVYLVGMEEGLLPHKRSVVDGGQSISEERRLCYVGVTRAKDELTLSFCKARMKWGKLRPQIPSRFLLEMRGDTQKAAEIALTAETQLRAEHARALEAEAEADAKREKAARKRQRTAAKEAREAASAAGTEKKSRKRGASADSSSGSSPSPSPAPPAASVTPEPVDPNAFVVPADQTVRDLQGGNRAAAHFKTPTGLPPSEGAPPPSAPPAASASDAPTKPRQVSLFGD